MYTLEIPLNTKGYDDFLAKRFKYGYKLKRAVTNWINCQEHRRVSSEEYKSLSLRTKELAELAEEGIIHWSNMEIIAQTVKGAYLQRRKQGESNNHVSIGRLMNFTTLWYRKCNNNVTDEGVFFATGKGRNDKLFIPFAFRREQELRLPMH